MLTEGHTWKLGNVTKKQVLERTGMVCRILPDIEPFIIDAVKLAGEKGWIRA